MDKIKNKCMSNEKLCKIGFSYILSVINGKYKITILYALIKLEKINLWSEKNILKFPLKSNIAYLKERTRHKI